jgi:hypothetical protein
MKKLLAFFATAALLLGLGACSVTDNPASGDVADNPNLPKQGVWTEYDTLLVAAGKNTMKELAEMPGVGMMIKGDKAYFFTYTAEGADDLMEGAITYDKDKRIGTIAFPTIKDSPVSGQTVNFTMTSSETMEFELEYEGVKETATCAWLCKNLDNWNTSDDSDWEELLAYYQTIPEDAGPDGSIDWSDSEVEGLDEPLVWEAPTAAARGNTRMATAVVEGVSAGLDLYSSLFEEDPNEAINKKLDAVLRKLNQALETQLRITIHPDAINDRLNGIAKTMRKYDIQEFFNTRNDKYYNPLRDQNTQYFDKAYDLYIKNKSDLNKVSADLGEYAKKWVGTDNRNIDLTWNYIEHLNTVQDSFYGKGMAAIYDGLTFDKYPWEHLGIGDRDAYRAYDMFVIAKCLFMINLYAVYGGLTDTQKQELYERYSSKKPALKAFCEFKVSNPDKFRVCQIRDAHFIMHKELQKYNYCGPNKKGPHPLFSREVIYAPEWHEAGNIKIENPKEVKSKLIHEKEATAIFKYYNSTVYRRNSKIWWTNMLVRDKNIAEKDNQAGGAVFAKEPGDNKKPILILTSNEFNAGYGQYQNDNYLNLMIQPIWQDAMPVWGHVVGLRKGAEIFHYQTLYWYHYHSQYEYYAAIIEKRY